MAFADHLFIMRSKGLLILFLLVKLPAFSAVVTINTDQKTIEAMTEAYTLGAAEETLYKEQLDSIYSSYTSSEVATAGIFASKYLDYLAKKDAGSFSLSSENYYYKRIYKLVASRIMPKVWKVAQLMLHSPSSALYWGSYLARICTEVESLCKQFEAVVTNYSLSFKDIVFLKVADEVTKEFNLDKASTLIEDMVNGFTSISDEVGKDALSSSIDELYSLGVGIATAGVESLTTSILNGNSFSSMITLNTSNMLSSMDDVISLLGNFSGSKATSVLASLGITSEEGISNFFSFSNYNIDSWISNYLSLDEEDEFYTQVWYIEAKDSGSEVIYSYTPAQEDEDILSGNEWIRISTSNTAYTLSDEEKEKVLSNSESYAGFSRSTVEELNNLDDGYTYTFKSTLLSCGIYSKNTQKQRAFAYELWIEKSWDFTNQVLESTYDSYSMDLTTFLAILEIKLAEFKTSDSGATYTLKSGNINYYSIPSAEALSNIETVTITETCSDGRNLSTGDTQYKCKEEGSSLSSHTIECAMLSSIIDNDIDLSELYALEDDIRSQISSKESEIAIVEDEIERLTLLINSNPTSMERAEYLEELNNYRAQLSLLTSELSSLNSDLEDTLLAIEEALNDNDVETDDYYRIPAIMEDVKKMYNLTWKGDGYWTGYTYAREATMAGVTGTIKFTATLTMERKPQRFLGILIHRAIIKISWELTADFENTTVVDILKLDNSASADEKREVVQERIRQVALDYPECQMTVEYKASDGVEQTSQQQGAHLLWASDRIEMAKEIEARLSKIYAQLISLEKFMHYKVSVLDVYKAISPYVNDTYGKRQTLIDEAFSRWKTGMYKAIGQDAPGSKVEIAN